MFLAYPTKPSLWKAKPPSVTLLFWLLPLDVSLFYIAIGSIKYGISYIAIPSVPWEREFTDFSSPIAATVEPS